MAEVNSHVCVQAHVEYLAVTDDPALVQGQTNETYPEVTRQ